MTTIQETFKQFCKERHAEDKGRNFDLLQEIYANTEFFDTSLCKVTEIPLMSTADKGNALVSFFPIDNFNLPFQNIFLQVADNQFLFIREYAPNILTGTFYVVDFIGKGNKLNVPFTIRLNKAMSMIMSDFNHPLFSKEQIQRLIKDTFTVAIGNCITLNELSKKSITVDKPTGNFYEYYRRKRASTIKIPQRPIYYILGEKHEDVSQKYSKIKPTGKLEYSYSFHVRGHWRCIDENSIGKDRNGNYNVKGYTWVTEYIKGEGELVKRIRIVE